MRSPFQTRWIYMLLGDNDSGKTTFQKILLKMLCNLEYDRLPSNRVYEIEHASFHVVEKIFMMGRSIQEFQENPTVVEYFSNDRDWFKDADICLLSSHVTDGGGCTPTITQMIEQGKRRKYNVASVFFSNAEVGLMSDISALPWDLRIVFSNPLTGDRAVQETQLRHLAQEFVTYSNR